MARPVLSFVQKSKKWADKEHDLLNAYRSGVAGGTADYVRLVLDKTRTEQLVNVPDKLRKLPRAQLAKKGIRFNGSQTINRSYATQNALRNIKFLTSESGIVTGRNQDGNISFQMSPTTGKFVGFIEITGKVGVAMKVSINKFRIRILSAGASKANTMWKKMVAAGLQQNMQKRFGALNQ